MSQQLVDTPNKFVPRETFIRFFSLILKGWVLYLLCSTSSKANSKQNERWTRRKARDFAAGLDKPNGRLAEQSGCEASHKAGDRS